MQAEDDIEQDFQMQNSEDGNSFENFHDLECNFGGSEQDVNDESSNFKPDGDGDNSCDPENDNNEHNEMEDFSDYGDSEDDDIDESEIDLLLEEGLTKSKRTDRKSETEQSVGQKFPEKTNDMNGELTIKKIVVVEEKGGNTFEVLPGGWIQVRHSSGLPLYLHRKSRVCSLTKPYFLGTASVRRHSIPLSAIPCLAYRRALEKEQRDKELLEEQAKQLETQPSTESTSENLPSGEGSSKSSGGNNEKDVEPVSMSNETVAAKINRLKRKIELEKESEVSSKREKIVPQCGSGEKKDTERMTAAKVRSGCIERATGNKNLVNKDSPGVRALIPLAKVETARENAHLYSITPLDLRDYCKSLFRFTEIECKRFKTWSARRRHTKEQKRKQLERPTLPDNAQVIKFFDISSCKGGDEQMVKKFNDYVFNPNGKSSVCILHEFVQHALRKQPTYTFQELENSTLPYSATVMINDFAYGRGLGSSKKTAKAEAAKATLEILIPQMKGQLNGSKTDTNSDFDITEYFQQVEMNDVRISKMCTSVSEPSPYTLLLTCLQRNFGQSGTNNVKFEMIPPDPSKGNLPNQFKMTAGNHSVVVTASNKREGKQLASQLLLSEIHPHITNFGAFIKMYGNGSIKSVKEKKQEEQQITTLQSKASANSPNWAILTKLRQEMLKLVEHDKERRPEDGKNFETSDKDDFDASDFGITSVPSPTKCPYAANELKESNPNCKTAEKNRVISSDTTDKKSPITVSARDDGLDMDSSETPNPEINL